MKKRFHLTLSLLSVCLCVTAQVYFPSVFGSDTSNIKIDELTRAYIVPQRILWTSSSTAVRDANLLLKPNTGQADIFSNNMCVLQNKDNDMASLILDFGREIHGGIKLVFSACSPSETPRIRLRFGESVSETCSELKAAHRDYNKIKEVSKENTATNDHAVRDMELTVPFYGQIEIGSTGYRFVRIDLLTPNMKVNFKEVTAIFRYRNIPYIGSFKCNNTRLNQIWETGAYTVHLNMQEYIWDGIKRDRLIWLGDMHPETSTISSVFGEDESFYKSMDLATQQYPLPAWINNMSAYSLWYLIIQHDWYLHFGNKEFIQKHSDYIKGLINQIDERIDNEGNEFLSNSRFLDWPSSENQLGVESGYRALIIWAIQDAAFLCRELNLDDYVAKCERICSKMKRKIVPPNNLKQAAALMAISGIMDPQTACNEVILKGGAEHFSTFYGYYMLEALAQAGRYQEAMDIISQFWGGMLDLGATTFWEDFNLDWTVNAARIDDFVPQGKADIHGDFGAYCYPGFRHSFCHGWASGPTAWMSQHILGISPVEPGCKKIRITPHLGNLNWVEGTYPTPLGTIYVKHQKRLDGTIKTTTKLPKGIKVVQ